MSRSTWVLWCAVALLVEGLAIEAAAQAGLVQPADSTHLFRFIMGTSIGVEAFGGDQTRRRAAIEDVFAAFEE